MYLVLVHCQQGFLRYFEEPEDESSKLKRTVCKNCGAKGDHKTVDCRAIIVSKFVLSCPYIPISYTKPHPSSLPAIALLVFDMWLTR